MDWKSEYAKSEGLTVTQSRILREGPKSLSEAWILNAMHYKFKRSALNTDTQ